MCVCVCAQLWLAAHTHTRRLSPHVNTGKDLATLLGNPVESPCSSSHRTRISHSPFAKMFLLEFYFISLDFDGFIVYPAPVMESLSPPACLPLPPLPHSSNPCSLTPLVKRCKQDAYANFVRSFKRIFGNVRGGCGGWKRSRRRKGDWADLYVLFVVANT